MNRRIKKKRICLKMMNIIKQIKDDNFNDIEWEKFEKLYQEYKYYIFRQCNKSRNLNYIKITSRPWIIRTKVYIELVKILSKKMPEIESRYIIGSVSLMYSPIYWLKRIGYIPFTDLELKIQAEDKRETNMRSQGYFVYGDVDDCGADDNEFCYVRYKEGKPMCRKCAMNTMKRFVFIEEPPRRELLHVEEIPFNK